MHKKSNIALKIKIIVNDIILKIYDFMIIILYYILIYSEIYIYFFFFFTIFSSFLLLRSRVSPLSFIIRERETRNLSSVSNYRSRTVIGSLAQSQIGSNILCTHARYTVLRHRVKKKK